MWRRVWRLTIFPVRSLFQKTQLFGYKWRRIVRPTVNLLLIKGKFVLTVSAAVKRERIGKFQELVTDIEEILCFGLWQGSLNYDFSRNGRTFLDFWNFWFEQYKMKLNMSKTCSAAIRRSENTSQRTHNENSIWCSVQGIFWFVDVWRDCKVEWIAGLHLQIQCKCVFNLTVSNEKLPW